MGDVTQGRLGNCGLGASISALCKHPEMIYKLFRTKKLSRHGAYEIQLCHNGMWMTYVIDDNIPCTYHGRPAFTTHSNKDVLWVPLLEKCAAKSYGGYDRLIAMCKLEAFNDLTGYPIEQVPFDV